MYRQHIVDRIGRLRPGRRQNAHQGERPMQQPVVGILFHLIKGGTTMSDDSAFQQDPADLLPFEDDSAAPGQVPIVLGEVEPEKFLYIGKGLMADEFSSYVQGYDFGKI